MPSGVKKRFRDDLLTEPIDVAILGSGGREHALAHQIAQSPLCRTVTVLPGNEGMVWDGLGKANPKIQTQAISFEDFETVAAKITKLKSQLVVVGPDELLAAGVVDDLEKAGFNVFGPRKAAAKIESSKVFAKEIMKSAGVPTARHEVVRAEDMGRLEEISAGLGGYPIVLKYDGLALGKGVQICADGIEAEAFLREVFEAQKFNRVGSAKSAPVVIAEEFLTGHEVSLFALTDGESYTLLEPACDYKRLLAGNNGPNTGGMGAYSPVPWLATDFIAEIGRRVFPPVLKALRELPRGEPFKGLLYAGMMVRDQEFWVLEFNARFGDPETQVLLPRLSSDLLPLLYSIAVGKDFQRYLDANPLRWFPRACVNIVLASRGYPEKPEVGVEIRFPHDLRADPQLLFFAGVKSSDAGLCTAGGRVLSVSALGDGLEEARQNALFVVRAIEFEGRQFREDVGRVGPGY